MRALMIVIFLIVAVVLFIPRESSDNPAPTSPAAGVPPPASLLTDAEIRQLLIEESIGLYSGNCPCPYNLDRAGNRCGGRSAYSRPGGASPLCFPEDVSDAVVESYRASARR